MTTKKDSPLSFSEMFQARLNDLEDRARRVGSNLTEVCRGAKIARATPDRWRKRSPRSIELIDRMAAEVARLEGGVA